MLIIDDVKKLARMQEVLLSRTMINRDENLKKYVDIIHQIDEDNFSKLVSEINQFNNHNHSLDEELRKLKSIKDSYDNVREQQFHYKKNCEIYGYKKLKLSDLSQIDIEYINSRIIAIGGYLVNQDNIENYKEKLEKLNEKLIDEEKNNDRLSKKLLDFEDRLRENFINAEGRIIVDGNIQYISIVSEYKELGYNFKELVNDSVEVNKLLSIVKTELKDVEEKLSVASICYRNIANDMNRQIYDEINLEYLNINYRLIMLEILNLVSNNYDNYDKFKNKRYDLLSFIKYRTECLLKLKVNISIDPFSYVKIQDQLDMISSIEDYSKNIVNIKREIASISDKLDKIILQNNVYLSSINYRKELMNLNTVINVDKCEEKTDFTIIRNNSKRYILDNQVVKVKDISLRFNLDIVIKKTRSVIRRVNEMMMDNIKKEENSTFNPDLVIVMESNNNAVDNNSIDIGIDNEQMVESGIITDNNVELEIFPSVENIFNDEISNNNSGNIEINVNNNANIEVTNNTDIFTTVDPFENAPLFLNKIDDTFGEVFVNLEEDNVVESDNVLEETNNNLELVVNDNKDNLDNTNIEIIDNSKLEEEMPDVFWVTQADNEEESEDSSEMSFDEQINVLLASDGKLAV